MAPQETVDQRALRHAEEEEALATTRVTPACTRGGAVGVTRDGIVGSARSHAHGELVSQGRSNQSGLAHDCGQRGCLNKGFTKPEANMQTKRKPTWGESPGAHANGQADMRRRRKPTWA